jgi:hypothetical protein
VPDAITTRSFGQLPIEEKVAIRMAINAMNRSRSMLEVEQFALKDKSLRVPASLADRLRAHLQQRKREAWVATQDGARIEKAYNAYVEGLAGPAFEQLRAAFSELARTGRIPAPMADYLALHYRHGVVMQPHVEFVSGRARCSQKLLFRDGDAVIALAMLRLSELSAHSPAFLQCAECGKFQIIESTGGDKISRFCRSRCRNKFTVRKWRADQRAATAKPVRARKHK